jgi:diguanylate cyclase (GGDEF)-like protein
VPKGWRESPTWGNLRASAESDHVRSVKVQNVRDDISIVVGADPGEPDDVRRDAAVRSMLPWTALLLAAVSFVAALVAGVEALNDHAPSLWAVAILGVVAAAALGGLAWWVRRETSTHRAPVLGADLLATAAVCVAGATGLLGLLVSPRPGTDPGWSMPVVIALAAAGTVMLSLRWLVATWYALWLAWLVCLTVGDTTFEGMVLWLVVGAAATGLGLVTCLSRRTLTDELARAQETAALASVRDPLTGLANRRGLSLLGQQMVEVARRQGDAVHCVYVDIDQLAHVNDVVGHEAGDEVVVAVADALRAVTRSTDVVARWGGDEFCVVGPGAGMAPMELERRVREKVMLNPPVPDEVWSPRVCAGGAMLAPWDSGSLDTLLGKADQEMYLRRALRRNDPRSRGNVVERRRTAGA